MKVITEFFLRDSFRKDIPETFHLKNCAAEDQIMPHSAAQFLNEKCEIEK